MKRKLGTAMIVAAAVLLIGAVGLYAYDSYRTHQAQAQSTEVMQQLSDTIYDRREEIQENTQPEEVTQPPARKTQMPTAEIEGETYVGYVGIPALELELPVTADWSYNKLLKSPCRFSGDMYTDDLVVMAHNYQWHFGTLKNLQPGDIVTFTDMDGDTVEYAVVTVDILERTAVEEMIAGEYDLTLFTCTYGGKSRVTVRCNKVKK